VPDVERRFLKGNLFDVFPLDPHRSTHFLYNAPLNRLSDLSPEKSPPGRRSVAPPAFDFA
jgi:hypothetical protein